MITTNPVFRKENDGVEITITFAGEEDNSITKDAILDILFHAYETRFSGAVLGFLGKIGILAKKLILSILWLVSPFPRSEGLRRRKRLQGRKIDKYVLEIMRNIFQHISGCPAEDRVNAAYKTAMADNHKTQERLEIFLKKGKIQLEKLRGEITKAMTGDSGFTLDDLMAALEMSRKKIAEDEETLKRLREEDEQERKMKDSLIPTYNQFRSGPDEFDAASWETKKMIACQLFKRIEVGKRYKIHIEINISYRQFVTEWADDFEEIIAGQKDINKKGVDFQTYEGYNTRESKG